ncbi:MAG TPA: acetyl-CoA hydrolase/transferase C-terminal domain-containing protein [Burkholderiales bacterium]|nr:acetyl-CoA hydrolase/transferase C-terminal domain-containing protein [Burkholderiales bacterium]
MIDLSTVIRPGDGIVAGQACAEPQTLLEALVAQRAALSGCSLFLGVNYSGIVKREHADHLKLSAYCGIGHNRALADAGVLDIVPAPYSRLGALIRAGTLRADAVFIQVSPPNARGEYSLGLAADYLVPALETCRVVVAEVNDQVPWTFSERLLGRNDFAALVETSRPPAAQPRRAPSERDAAIARHAAALIPDGAVLEFGIGALPDAVCGFLHERRNLSIHSGTVGDGIVELFRKGIARRADCAMLIGPRQLFELARDNPAIRLRSSEYTHDPRVLGTLERFVAINSAVEVDLSGQINSELAAGSYVGAVGGALDFMRATNHSRDGLSLTLLPASRVVAELSGPITVPRSEAGIIVTEHGAADLRGASLAERRRRLMDIAP